MVDEGLLGQTGRIVHLLHIAMLVIYQVRYVRNSGDDVHIELAVETLLHNLHVEQTEEAATESKAKSYGRLGRKGQRSVVKLQFLQRSTKVLILARVNRIDTGEHHRLHFLESGNGFLARTVYVSDGIAHLHLRSVLDAGDDIAHLTGAKHLTRHHIHLEHANLVGFIFHARIEELHLVALANLSALNLEVGNDATERVEHGVEDKRLQRCLLVTRGMRNTLHDGTQHVLHAFAGLT